MKSIIILLGPPASGKGTHASLLAEKLGYENLSAGSLLREEVATGSEIGKEIATLIDAGNLVSDELMFKVLSKRLESSNSSGFILDGFPRTLRQAEILSDYVDKSDMQIKKVFVIDVDKENILDRICNRITCKECGAIYNAVSKRPKVEGVCDVCGSKELVDRSDDLNKEAVEKRIDIFKTNIGGIMSFYEKKSLIFLINGLKNVSAINCEIIKALS